MLQCKKIKEVEIQKNELLEKVTSYEELLQEGRYKLKELTMENKELITKINHYENLITKFYNNP